MATSLRPGWFVRKVANPVVARLGLATTLVLRGRSSGVERSEPVNVLEKWDYQVQRFFEELPDAADHPAFVIEAVLGR